MATIKYEDFDEQETYEFETHDRHIEHFLSTLSYDDLIKIARIKLTKEDLIEALSKLYGLSFNDLTQGDVSVLVKDFYEQEAKDAYEQEQYERRDPYGARGLCERDFN